MSSLLISIQGEGLVEGFAGGGAMLGFTGRMIGGGLSTGRFVSVRGLCSSVFRVRVGEALRLWGMSSTTIPRIVFCEAGGMTPKVIKTKSSPTLIATASAKPESRRCNGCRA
jgi:hypothetical protein